MAVEPDKRSQSQKNLFDLLIQSQRLRAAFDELNRQVADLKERASSVDAQRSGHLNSNEPGDGSNSSSTR